MTFVDVLAYHDALIAQHKALSADAYHVQELSKAEAVRAAVDELIEAGRELHDALHECWTDDESRARIKRRNVAAVERHATALARVQGGGA